MRELEESQRGTVTESWRWEIRFLGARKPQTENLEIENSFHYNRHISLIKNMTGNTH